jgi:hypothetical protein
MNIDPIVNLAINQLGYILISYFIWGPLPGVVTKELQIKTSNFNAENNWSNQATQKNQKQTVVENH